jgi:hypothetical protein
VSKELKQKLKNGLAAISILAVAGVVGLVEFGKTPAWAAGFFTWPLVGTTGSESATTGSETIPADTQLPQGINPATVTMTLNQAVYGFNQTANNATSFTASAANVASGGTTNLLLTGAPSTAQNLTLPTPAAIVAQLPYSSVSVGLTWTLRIVNVGGTASGAWTVVANGNTITGNTSVPVASSRLYQVTVTNVATPAVTFQDFGQ